MIILQCFYLLLSRAVKSQVQLCFLTFSCSPTNEVRPKELGGNGIRTADLNRPEEYSILYGIFHILGRKVLQAMGVLSAAALGVSWASVVGW